jgi:hypothetical protein
LATNADRWSHRPPSRSDVTPHGAGSFGAATIDTIERKVATE